MKTLKEIKTALIKEGAKEIKNLTVKNVTVAVKENYTRLGLTLDRDVDAYVADDEGNYKLGKSNVIFLSAFSVASMLRENEKTAFLGNKIKDNPDLAEVFLSHATINIVQETVNAETEWVNPFKDEPTDEDTVTYDHDVIINHLMGIELSETAIGYIKDIVLESIRRK